MDERPPIEQPPTAEQPPVERPPVERRPIPRDRPRAIVAWSTRSMPYWLRERMRAEAALRGITIENVFTLALTIGLRELERRRLAETAARRRVEQAIERDLTRGTRRRTRGTDAEQTEV